jgi:thiol-disulfide isomerase/thioredoxin
MISSEALQGASISHPLFVATMLDLLSADGLIAKLSAAEYLGEAKVGSTKCHHLLLTIDSNEFEVWIDAGDKPHLRKVVPKLERWLADHVEDFPKDAKVEMTLAFKNWATDVKVSDSQFKFTPLEGLKQVASFSGTAGAEKEGPEVLLNKPAPRFELALVSGGSMSLAEHKGKNVVIVDFWATWCGPCVKSLPIISEVAASYKSKGVVFYAVNLRQGPEDINPFLQEKQLPITVAMDSTGSVAQTYKVSGIPTTILIGKDGTVQQVHVGFGDNLKAQLTKELDTLLSGKTLARARE